MKVNVQTKVISVSNRIAGTSDDGRSYDYYRVTLLVDDRATEFRINNSANNSAAVTKLVSHKFGDDVKVQMDFVKAKQGQAWYCNIVDVVG